MLFGQCHLCKWRTACNKIEVSLNFVTYHGFDDNYPGCEVADLLNSGMNPKQVEKRINDIPIGILQSANLKNLSRK
ncbi:hypothetical protein AGMMS49975_24690 [Clostridia bacterium]|nr:hypothetical protein AGMMS49975_24690 [Clostridia bacterium]